MDLIDWLLLAGWVGMIFYAQFHCDDHARNWSCTRICYGKPVSVRVPGIGTVRVGGRNVITGPGIPVRHPKRWEGKHDATR